MPIRLIKSAFDVGLFLADFLDSLLLSIFCIAFRAGAVRVFSIQQFPTPCVF
jgi:hypothetical protein